MAHELADQERWNSYGAQRIHALETNPDAYIIKEAPIAHWACYDDLMKGLQPLPGKKLLEMGCGRGDFAVFLATQGAEVTGIDRGEDLIEASKLLAKINNVQCIFQAMSVADLPYETNSYDLVVGLDILHHLPPTLLHKTLDETYRVLRPGGKAIFFEPVENSSLFATIQNLVPAGRKGSDQYRPSILDRKSWAKYQESLDDRDLTNRELASAGPQFRSVTFQPHGFLIRLERLIGRKFRPALLSIDRTLLKLPPIAYLCQAVLVEYRKA